MMFIDTVSEEKKRFKIVFIYFKKLFLLLLVWYNFGSNYHYKFFLTYYW